MPTPYGEYRRQALEAMQQADDTPPAGKPIKSFCPVCTFLFHRGKLESQERVDCWLLQMPVKGRMQRELLCKEHWWQAMQRHGGVPV